PDRALDDTAQSARRLIAGTSRPVRWILRPAWLAGRTRRRVSWSRSLRPAIWVRVPGRTWRFSLIPWALTTNWNHRHCSQADLAMVAGQYPDSGGFCQRSQVARPVAVPAARELRWR